MRRRSRLNQTQEKKRQKTTILSIIGILIVLFVMFKFGISALVNFSLLLSGNGNNNNSKTNDSSLSYIAPPVLNPLPEATNSARIVISGTSPKNSTVNLYINNKKVDELDTNTKGGFNFEENLSQGNNSISAKTEIKSKQSDFSNSYSVTFSNQPPKLDISAPSDGQSFNKNQVNTDNSISVSGKTDSGATVTVNGFVAILDENDNFSYSLPLQNGDNQIKIIAIDNAGNKTEKDLKVNFSQ